MGNKSNITNRHKGTVIVTVQKASTLTLKQYCHKQWTPKRLRCPKKVKAVNLVSQLFLSNLCLQLLTYMIPSLLLVIELSTDARKLLKTHITEKSIHYIKVYLSLFTMVYNISNSEIEQHLLYKYSCYQTLQDPSNRVTLYTEGRPTKPLHCKSSVTQIKFGILFG